jgi:hypothetical protein
MAITKAVPAKIRATQKPMPPGQPNTEGSFIADGAPIRGYKKRSNTRRSAKP